MGDQPCGNCSGCGEVVEQHVVGYDDDDNPVTAPFAVICSTCLGTGKV